MKETRVKTQCVEDSPPQNKMMNFIWLLNAADNSAFETKGLYTEFLSQKDDFKKTSLCLEANKPQYDFFAREILRNLESMEELRTTIDEAIGVLRSSIKASSHSSKEIENDDR